MLTEAIIQGYEERGFNAWPALHTLVVDGWLLRFAQGHSRRANSVNAWSSTARVDDIVDLAAASYRQQNIPLLFRITPLVPPGFDARLERQGFERVDPSLVMVRPLELPLAFDPAVALTERPTPDWLHGVEEAAHLSHHARQAHHAILSAVRLPAVFATLYEDGVPLAFGMAVLERGAIGLFDVVTVPQARRRGVSRRLCKTLLAWGQQRSARAAYLQVLAANHAAVTLYENLGFVLAYRYHYRIPA